MPSLEAFIYIQVHAHVWISFSCCLARHCNVRPPLKTKWVERTPTKPPSPPRDLGTQLKKGPGCHAWLFCSLEQTHSKPQLPLSPVLLKDQLHATIQFPPWKKLFSWNNFLKTTYSSVPENNWKKKKQMPYDYFFLACDYQVSHLVEAG